MGNAVITSLYFITFCYMLYIIYLLYEYTINILIILCCINLGFARGSVGKNLLAEQMTQVRALGQEDSPGGGNGNPLQYSCLGNPMDRGSWWDTVYRVVK